MREQEWSLGACTKAVLFTSANIVDLDTKMRILRKVAKRFVEPMKGAQPR